jgi:hypothetical protein
MAGSSRHSVRVAADCLVAEMAAAGLFAGSANPSSEGMPSYQLAGNPRNLASPANPGPGSTTLKAAANLVKAAAARPAVARRTQAESRGRLAGQAAADLRGPGGAGVDGREVRRGGRA